MKRRHLSGAEGRKIRKKREEEAKSLSGSLLKFVQPSKVNDQQLVNNTNSTFEDGDECIVTETEGVKERSQNAEEKEEESKIGFNESNEAVALNKIDEDSNFNVISKIESDSVKPKGSDIDDVNRIEDSLLKSPKEKETTEQDDENYAECVGDRIHFYSDVGDWPCPLTNDLRVDLIKQGSEYFQNKEGPFNIVQRQGEKTKGESRQLTTNWFYKILPNGEKVLRKWMVYSQKKKAIFCFCCKLFSADLNETSTSTFVSGFDKWWKLNPKVGQHECSEHHLTCLEKWKTLAVHLKSNSTIDSLYQQEQEVQRKTWRDVLERLLDITLFLAKQNLPFRGHRESETSNNRGNFLELVELLSHYDPVLKEHLVRLQQTGPTKKVLTTYLSPKTQNEFINILGDTVKIKVLDDIRSAKYFGILFDSTPDVSHNDQMSQVIRYVHIEMGKVEIRESFLGFFLLSGKKAAEVTEEILKALNDNGLDIKNCRSQGYDNASVMSGVHSGVQARILEINPKAMFVPCANHSLNLCGVHAFANNATCVTFFGTLESIYKFFSSSTHRWDTLLGNMKEGSTASIKTVKRLCETRWSAHHDAVKAVMVNFKEIVQAIEDLCDPSENIDTRSSGGILLKAIDFSFLSYLFLWAHVLEEVNQTQKYLQTEGITIDKAVKKMEALKIFIDENRDDLSTNALVFAREICQELDIPIQKSGRRKFKKIMPGELAKDVGLTLEEEINRSMLECMDTFNQELVSRLKSMEKICRTFAVVESCTLISATEDTLTELSANLTEHMNELEKEAIVPEIRRLRRHLQAFKISEDISKKWSALQMLQFIVDLDIQESVPNVFLALKFFLTSCVSISTCERSFSKLKLIKSYLRSTMSETRLNGLAILSIEKSVTKNIDFQNVINQFANAKVRKVKV